MKWKYDLSDLQTVLWTSCRPGIHVMSIYLKRKHKKQQQSVFLIFKTSDQVIVHNVAGLAISETKMYTRGLSLSVSISCDF